MLYATQCDTPAPDWPSTSYMRIAKLLVPAGGLVQASCGDTFVPGHGQISVEPGRHGSLGSSAANRGAIRAPSLIDVDVSVKYDAACMLRIVATIATASARLSPRMRVSFGVCSRRSLPRRRSYPMASS